MVHDATRYAAKLLLVLFVALALRAAQNRGMPPHVVRPVAFAVAFGALAYIGRGNDSTPARLMRSLAMAAGVGLLVWLLWLVMPT